MPWIWRVENRLGDGCYYLHPETKNILGKHLIDGKHPNIIHDIGRRPRKNEICGFSSRTKVYKWFNKRHLHRLEKMGFFLKKIEVEKITATGHRQVLAIR